MKLICASSIPIGHFAERIEVCFTAQQSTKTKTEQQAIAKLKNPFSELQQQLVPSVQHT